MSTSKPRESGICLQPRDVKILRGLFESRVMTLPQIAAIYFDGRPEAAKMRLRKLRSAGLVRARERHGDDPRCLCLSPGGLSLLTGQGILKDYPQIGVPAFKRRLEVSELTLRHEIQVMDVKAAFHAAASHVPSFSILEFTTWPALSKFEARDARGRNGTVKPDGFFRLRDSAGANHSAFLEVDRSTEILDTLISRVSRYNDYYKSGGFALRCGAPATGFRSFPFRVLIVLKSEERRNNLAERLLANHPPIFTQVWLTTFEEITAAPFGACWVRPVDYRDAIKGTLLFQDRSNSWYGYRRQTAREEYVAKSVVKHALLGGEMDIKSGL